MVTVAVVVGGDDDGGYGGNGCHGRHSSMLVFLEDWEIGKECPNSDDARTTYWDPSQPLYASGVRR